MKRTYTYIAIVLMAAGLPQPSRAQFLKTLVNNVKQNLGNKAAGNATQTTGKPDSSARSKSVYDSTYFAQLMAKANRPKPSISPADSAAAIKSFRSGTGGSGLLYQYHVIYNFRQKNKDSTFSDTMSIAITDGHNTRSDIGILGGKMGILGHAGMPRYSITLYPDSKTYVFNIIDTAAINSDGGTYQATKIGTETVLGYKCIHSKLTSVPAGQKSVMTQDIWTCTSVPGYADFKKLSTTQGVTPKMMQVLEQAGCGGSIVKSDMQSKGFSMDMQLITAARRDFPASMFQLPAGYTQVGNMMTGMMLGLQK